MQRSRFWRPKRTCSGRSIFMSCIETFATRFARRCNSCSSGDRRLMSNSSPNPDPSAAAPGSISSSSSASALNSSSATDSSTTGAGLGGAWRAGGVCAAFGTGCEGAGRCGAAGGSGATLPTKSLSCASIGDRGPVCMDTATNLDSTSKVAASEAAEVCARSSDGRALVGLLLAHAETTSFTA